MTHSPGCRTGYSGEGRGRNVLRGGRERAEGERESSRRRRGKELNHAHCGKEFRHSTEGEEGERINVQKKFFL